MTTTAKRTGRPPGPQQLITVRGVTLTLADWTRVLGFVGNSTLVVAARRGVPYEEFIESMLAQIRHDPRNIVVDVDGVRGTLREWATLLDISRQALTNCANAAGMALAEYIRVRIRGSRIRKRMDDPNVRPKSSLTNEQIVELYDEGTSITAIAKLAGVSRQRVSQILRKHTRT